ncbi:MAG: hypothetical protein K1060chlam2_01293 [Chlamydiae bacterium]|nr:hypothetical protein [Chlamydiota bacterium]
MISAYLPLIAKTATLGAVQVVLSSLLRLGVKTYINVPNRDRRTPPWTWQTDIITIGSNLVIASLLFQRSLKIRAIASNILLSAITFAVGRLLVKIPTEAEQYNKLIRKGIRNHGKPYSTEDELTTAKTMLREGGVKFSDFESRKGSTLCWAASQGYLAMVQFIVEDNHIDPNLEGTISHTPIHYATKYGSIETFNYLRGKGADINSKDQSERTLLEVAAGANSEKGSPEIIDILLSEDSTFDLKDDSETLSNALYFAVKNKDIPIIKALREHGAETDEETDALIAADDGLKTLFSKKV